MKSLKQVVGKKRVLRNGTFQRRHESVYVIKPLAGENAFTEEVLVGVRYGGGIRIDPRVPGIQSRKQRAGGAHERHADPWLQDAVALGDTACAGIEGGAVEGMNDDPDELSGHAARKSSIAIQGEAVLDLRQDAQISN